MVLKNIKWYDVMISRQEWILGHDEYRKMGSDIHRVPSSLSGLTVLCPICGREFGCNKAYHVYTARTGRKRQYYCSYSCYKKRLNPKEKDEGEVKSDEKQEFK